MLLQLPPGWRIASVEESERIHCEADLPSAIAGKNIYITANIETFRQFLRAVTIGDTFRFACQRCGHCCSLRVVYGERLMHEEALRLAEFCRQNNYPLPRRFGDAYHIPTSDKGACLWLDHNLSCRAICRVQELKPHICRLAPCGCILDHETKTVALAVKRPFKHRTYDHRECLGVIGFQPKISVEEWLHNRNLVQLIIEAEQDYQEALKEKKPCLPSP